MVSTYSLQEKFDQVRRNFCFYLDIHDNGVARTLSKRIEDLGLSQEVFLTERVSHVIRDTVQPVGGGGTRWVSRDGARSRVDAMLQQIRPETEKHHPLKRNYVILTVQKAIILLDKIYDTFFIVKKETSVKIFKKHFIKIEFLDKICRPVYKEFDEWPYISLEPDLTKEKKVDTPQINKDLNRNQQRKAPAGQKMTRKSRPGNKKERDDKEPKGGYCEMCNTDYIDAVLHRRSPHHLAFVKDNTNYLSLDSLIEAGADVATFLDKATPLNGERRSLRKLCNGDIEKSKSKRSKRSQSIESTINGEQSPKRNGGLDDDRKRNTRCSKRISESQLSEDRQYYKVVGVSTKLRSSGGFSVKRKESPPTCNGTKPLVVKFRKIRQSELSVLSDEAEQFMFPKRASSTSSTSSEDEDEEENDKIDIKSTPQPSLLLERRRLARPLALKEESSEEDSWSEDKYQRKRQKPPMVKRARRLISRSAAVVESPAVLPEPEPVPSKPEELCSVVNPLREDGTERCMKWEDGKLKYTPAVEQLEFAFESVPLSEPWFETFKRQDEDKIVAKNVPRYFSLYTTKSPKLPYEIGQLPPLKPNCCPLSDLVKRDEKAGPSRSYGTRGMKRQKIRKKTAAAALIAIEGQPRKSPREHASTLAILGSAGLLHRRHPDDAKSTASEDTISETMSNVKVEPVISEAQEASERLQQFMSEVFEDAAEYEIPEEAMEGEAAVTMSINAPDVLCLVSECDNCEIIRDEIREGAVAVKPKGRRGRLKRMNRTGWPNKKKLKKNDSRSNSSELKVESSIDRSSAEPQYDETTQDSISEEGEIDSKDDIPLKQLPKSEENTRDTVVSMEADLQTDEDDDKPLKLDVKVLVRSDDIKNVKKLEQKGRSSVSESEDKEERYRQNKRPPGGWLQPVVRVARVEAGVMAGPRRLRSAAPRPSPRPRPRSRPRPARLR